MIVKKLAVGCHYLPPGPQLPPSRRRHHCPLAGTKLYCLVIQAQRCEKLADSYHAAAPGWELNPRSPDCKPDVLPHPLNSMNDPESVKMSNYNMSPDKSLQRHKLRQVGYLLCGEIVIRFTTQAVAKQCFGLSNCRLIIRRT